MKPVAPNAPHQTGNDERGTSKHGAAEQRKTSGDVLPSDASRCPDEDFVNSNSKPAGPSSQGDRKEKGSLTTETPMATTSPQILYVPTGAYAPPPSAVGRCGTTASVWWVIFGVIALLAIVWLVSISLRRTDPSNAYGAACGSCVAGEGPPGLVYPDSATAQMNAYEAQRYGTYGVMPPGNPGVFPGQVRAIEQGPPIPEGVPPPPVGVLAGAYEDTGASAASVSDTRQRARAAISPVSCGGSPLRRRIPSNLAESSDDGFDGATAGARPCAAACGISGSPYNADCSDADHPGPAPMGFSPFKSVSASSAAYNPEAPGQTVYGAGKPTNPCDAPDGQLDVEHLMPASWRAPVGCVASGDDAEWAKYAPKKEAFDRYITASGSARLGLNTRNPLARQTGIPLLLRPGAPLPLSAKEHEFLDSDFRQTLVYNATGFYPQSADCC